MDDLSTTVRDLTALLCELREPLDDEAKRLVAESWDEILDELALREFDDDVVVVLSDAGAEWSRRRLPYLMNPVVERATAVALVREIDPVTADWLAARTRHPSRIDIVVEVVGQLTSMRIDRAPRLDESRSFTLWSHGRAQRARYVFLESGEAVAPWSTLAALLGMDELMLDTVLHRATPEGSSSALSFTTIAERDGDWVRCVRIDRVDAFLSHVDWLTGGEQ